MNAIKLLVADHKEVDRMFKEAETAPRSKKRDIFFKIKTTLEAHAWLEETIFYPTLQAESDKELIKLTAEAIQEHIGAKCFLGELAAVTTDPVKFDALFAKLVEDVRHHVREEEGEMFPAVQNRFSADALDVLGAQMESEKKRFQSSAETIYG
ncbi:MAG: hemerythrin domain-containing protein [Pyrinomonadaceae bacterium]